MGNKIQLRQYQTDAINSVLNEPIGSKVILALAVGLGKSFTSAQLVPHLEAKLGRPIRTLWISRQTQLVLQPMRYFDNKTMAMEMGKHTSNGEDIVFATAQSLSRRLDRFDPHEFDLVIADECFTGDVEILTEKGFVRFDELGDEKVAQVDDNLTHDFVKPIRKIAYHYEGDLIMSRVDTSSRSGGKWIAMTPNHQQVYYNNYNGKLERVSIKDYSSGGDKQRRIINHLLPDDINENISHMERIYIMAQADGAITHKSGKGFRYRFAFSKQRKIDRFLELCKKADIEVKVGTSYTPKKGNAKTSYNFYITLDVDCTKLENLFSYGVCYNKANQILEEASLWDGYIKNERTINYDSTIKENSDFMNYIGFVAGWNSVLDVIHRKNKKHNTIYRVAFTKLKSKTPFKCGDKFNIGKQSHDGMVYCVEVPTNNIIIRKDGCIIVTSNCQEAKGKQYEDVINYFKPSYTVGLSGTPFRLDGKKLTDNLFDKIVYQRNIKWGIENGFLCHVDAVRCYIGYDLSSVKTSGGDYNVNDLNDAMVGTEHAVAEAYEKYSQGRPTLIFATGVDHAFAIASLIDGAEVIVGETKQDERDRIFNGFENKEIPCIVSVEVMTQGVDLPIATVGIFAKPTKSVGRYQQQVGRILRTHPEKDKALIVDCIGSSNLGLCTAPNIIGINLEKVPEKKLDELEGDLMEMIELAEELSDIPSSWIRNSKQVDLWAKENDYKTDKVNYFQMPDGRMIVSLPERAKIIIPAPDMLGNVDATQIIGLAQDFHEWGIAYYGETWVYQRALNAVKANLERNYQEDAQLWDLAKVKRWGKDPASEAQMKLINRRLKDEAPQNLTKFEAAQIINRLKNK